MTTVEPTPQAPYVPARPIMTAAELASHRVRTYPRDYDESDDGYGDMEAEQGRGWAPIAGWGADGWDLGDWPYVIIMVRSEYGAGRLDTAERYELLQIIEGDRTVWRFDTLADRHAAIDYLLIAYGLGNGGYDDWATEGVTPDKLPALHSGTLRVPDRLRGPYRP